MVCDGCNLGHMDYLVCIEYVRHMGNRLFNIIGIGLFIALGSWALFMSVVGLVEYVHG